jgi:hypothetical protein
MKFTSFVRASGLVAVAAAVFVACGGRVESEYSDAGSELAGPNCGNGRIDDGEQCDGTHLGGATCDSATMGTRTRGTPSCKACKLDTTSCTGNGGNNGTGGSGNGTGGRGTANGGRANGTGGMVGTGGRVTSGSGGTATTTTCTSSRDCGGRQVCCGTRTGTTYTFDCAASCRNGTTAACHQASDCGRGEVCCGTTNQAGTDYSSMKCATTCNGNGERVLCGSSQECPQGQTCQTSRVLPTAFKYCR